MLEKKKTEFIKHLGVKAVISAFPRNWMFIFIRLLDRFELKRFGSI